MADNEERLGEMNYPAPMIATCLSLFHLFEPGVIASFALSEGSGQEGGNNDDVCCNHRFIVAQEDSILSIIEMQLFISTQSEGHWGLEGSRRGDIVAAQSSFEFSLNSERYTYGSGR